MKPTSPAFGTPANWTDLSPNSLRMDFQVTEHPLFLLTRRRSFSRVMKRESSLSCCCLIWEALVGGQLRRTADSRECRSGASRATAIVSSSNGLTASTTFRASTSSTRKEANDHRPTPPPHRRGPAISAALRHDQRGTSLRVPVAGFAVRPAPTGQRHLAQRCRHAATLGQRSRLSRQPQRGCVPGSSCTQGHNPIRG